jgi:hypothetical protein
MLAVKKNVRRTGAHELNRAAPTTGDDAPDDEHDHRPHHRADQSGTLAGAVPADCLAEIGGKKRSDDAQDRREDEPEGSLSPGVMNFTIRPATNPMMIVQMMLME